MNPSIYVACLASYNNGTLHGVWIDCTGKDADGIRTEIAAMLRESPHPNATIDCPDCAEIRRGIGIIEGRTPTGYRPDIRCATCDGAGRVPSAEEWAVHDYDGIADMGEFPDLDAIVSYAKGIKEHGDAFRAFATTGPDELTSDAFSDAFMGEGDSPADIAETLRDETGMLDSVPENLRRYFDWEAYARDMRYEGTHFVEYAGRCYAFHH